MRLPIKKQKKLKKAGKSLKGHPPGGGAAARQRMFEQQRGLQSAENEDTESEFTPESEDGKNQIKSENEEKPA